MKIPLATYPTSLATKLGSGVGVVFIVLRKTRCKLQRLHLVDNVMVLPIAVRYSPTSTWFLARLPQNFTKLITLSSKLAAKDDDDTHKL